MLDFRSKNADERGFIRAFTSGIWRDIGISIFQRTHDGRVLVAEPITLKHLPEDQIGDLIDRSTLAISKDTAQVLMDDLWNCGVRPSEGEGSAGSFSAQNKHLQDIRAMLRHATGAALP